MNYVLLMNNTDALTTALDEMLGNLKTASKEKVDRKQVGLWVPTSHHEKYKKIQKATDRKFGVVLQELIKRAIDRVEI